MKVLHPSLNDQDLAQLQADTFKYFLREWNPENGLIPDSTRKGAPCSIAAVAFALTVYPIGVERKYISRKEAIKRTLKKLRFFHGGPEGKGTECCCSVPTSIKPMAASDWPLVTKASGRRTESYNAICPQ